MSESWRGGWMEGCSDGVLIGHLVQLKFFVLFCSFFCCGCVFVCILIFLTLLTVHRHLCAAGSPGFSRLLPAAKLSPPSTGVWWCTFQSRWWTQVTPGLTPYDILCCLHQYVWVIIVLNLHWHLCFGITKYRISVFRQYFCNILKALSDYRFVL